MNERIRSLALKAKLGGAEFDNGIRYYVGTAESFERFAELIVRECSNIVFEAGCTRDNPNCPDEELYQLSNRIEQHFGVEP